MTFLLLTIRFVDDRYHGLFGRKGPREWPPSPFRLFCALVAGVARRGELDGEMGKALAWLQKLDPPIIIAPRARNGQAIIRFVPNNDGDKKPDRHQRLTAKHTLPTLMLDKPNVHYLWDISDEKGPPMAAIRDAARNLTSLGWGVDMAFADAKPITEPEAQKLIGIRWRPKPKVWRDEGMLRVPVVDAELQECTLCDLKHCHQTAIARIEHGQPLRTVAKPRVFERVFYASSERPLDRPYRVFELKDADGERIRPPYPHYKLIHIAGMVRHLAIRAMASKALLEELYPDHDQSKDPFRDGSPPPGIEKPDDWVESYIAGHVADRSHDHRQLSYLPLPSIGHEHTDPGVRRVMIVAPVGDDALLDHVARRLAGQMLKPVRGDEFAGHEPPLLVPMPWRSRDGVVRAYTESANAWASVTPVILPGHDDHKPDKSVGLIEKALAQSGIEQPCEFEWSAFSRFPKSLSAHKYDKEKRPTGYIRPDHLMTQTAVHLTVRFVDDLHFPGPLAIGAGRHCGFGVMAALV